MEFLDYLYLKFRKNFLMTVNELTHNDFHLRKVKYSEKSRGDYISYLIQHCDFKYEKDSFPLLILVEWQQETMFQLLNGILDGVTPQDAADFSKELLNISVGQLKSQVSPESYEFAMNQPASCQKRSEIPKYETFIPMEESFLISSTDKIYGCLSFYFEEE